MSIHKLVICISGTNFLNQWQVALNCPKNLDAIYICHSNGIYYEVVLNVLSDTKIAPSNCFSNICKRKIGQQESDSEDNISIKKKLKVTND